MNKKYTEFIVFLYIVIIGIALYSSDDVMLKECKTIQDKLTSLKSQDNKNIYDVPTTDMYLQQWYYGLLNMHQQIDTNFTRDHLLIKWISVLERQTILLSDAIKLMRDYLRHTFYDTNYSHFAELTANFENIELIAFKLNTYANEPTLDQPKYTFVKPVSPCIIANIKEFTSILLDHTKKAKQDAIDKLKNSFGYLLHFLLDSRTDKVSKPHSLVQQAHKQLFDKTSNIYEQPLSEEAISNWSQQLKTLLEKAKKINDDALIACYKTLAVISKNLIFVINNTYTTKDVSTIKDITKELYEKIETVDKNIVLQLLLNDSTPENNDSTPENNDSTPENRTIINEFFAVVQLLKDSIQRAELDAEKLTKKERGISQYFKNFLNLHSPNKAQ
jgi:hypothetical protein